MADMPDAAAFVRRTSPTGCPHCRCVWAGRWVPKPSPRPGRTQGARKAPIERRSIRNGDGALAVITRTTIGVLRDRDEILSVNHEARSVALVLVGTCLVTWPQAFAGGMSSGCARWRGRGVTSCSPGSQARSRPKRRRSPPTFRGFVPGTGLARNAGPVSRFAMRRIMPVMPLTPFATSRSTAGRHLADIVRGTTQAPTGSYVDRGRVDRSSQESCDPQREGELWDAAERFTAAYTRRVRVPRRGPARCCADSRPMVGRGTAPGRRRLHAHSPGQWPGLGVRG